MQDLSTVQDFKFYVESRVLQRAIDSLSSLITYGPSHKYSDFILMTYFPREYCAEMISLDGYVFGRCKFPIIDDDGKVSKDMPERVDLLLPKGLQLERDRRWGKARGFSSNNTLVSFSKGVLYIHGMKEIRGIRQDVWKDINFPDVHGAIDPVIADRKRVTTLNVDYLRKVISSMTASRKWCNSFPWKRVSSNSVRVYMSGEEVGRDVKPVVFEDSDGFMTVGVMPIRDYSDRDTGGVQVER